MADRIIDATGLRCPLPVLKMEAALRQMTAGEALEITSDDPIASVDLPHFAQENGHNIKLIGEKGPQKTWRVICQPDNTPSPEAG